MKTRGIIDLYLPGKIAFHIKLIIGCFIFSYLWGKLFLNAQLNFDYFIAINSIMIFDLEIVVWIKTAFQKYSDKYTKQLYESSSIKKIIGMDILMLFGFYIFFIALNVVGFSLYFIIFHWVKGLDFPDLIEIISKNNIVVITAVALLISFPFFLIQKWITALRNEFKLREQNLIFQNETLKNQVNPHFLFNSLNTLSSLVGGEVKVAEEFIARLSIIYRYILDSTVKPSVLLKDEIDFIKDYIYLHQIRAAGKILLNIDIEEKYYEYYILPVSLQLLIENAIKHNKATIEKPLIIDVFAENDYILVKNNIQKPATKVQSTKIGLNNLSERVKILSGKEIIITTTNDEFIVKVPLKR